MWSIVMYCKVLIKARFVAGLYNDKYLNSTTLWFYLRYTMSHICPIYIPYMTHICPIPYKIWDIYGLYMALRWLII